MTTGPSPKGYAALLGLAGGQIVRNDYAAWTARTHNTLGKHNFIGEDLNSEIWK